MCPALTTVNPCCSPSSKTSRRVMSFPATSARQDFRFSRSTTRGDWGSVWSRSPTDEESRIIGRAAVILLPATSSRVIAQRDEIPRLQPSDLGQVSVADPGPLGALEILDEEAIVLADDPGMPLGDRVIGEHDLAGGLPAEDRGFSAERECPSRRIALLHFQPHHGGRPRHEPRTSARYHA
jgi:hypothetical protein